MITAKKCRTYAAKCNLLAFSLYFPGRAPLSLRELEVLELISIGSQTRKPQLSSGSVHAQSKTTARIL
jgi:hypothetical protein